MQGHSLQTLQLPALEELRRLHLQVVQCEHRYEKSRHQKGHFIQSKDQERVPGRKLKMQRRLASKVGRYSRNSEQHRHTFTGEMWSVPPNLR